MKRESTFVWSQIWEAPEVSKTRIIPFSKGSFHVQFFCLSSAVMHWYDCPMSSQNDQFFQLLQWSNASWFCHAWNSRKQLKNKCSTPTFPNLFFPIADIFHNQLSKSAMLLFDQKRIYISAKKKFAQIRKIKLTNFIHAHMPNH